MHGHGPRIDILNRCRWLSYGEVAKEARWLLASTHIQLRPKPRDVEDTSRGTLQYPKPKPKWTRETIKHDMRRPFGRSRRRFGCFLTAFWIDPHTIPLVSSPLLVLLSRGFFFAIRAAPAFPSTSTHIEPACSLAFYGLLHFGGELKGGLRDS